MLTGDYWIWACLSIFSGFYIFNRTIFTIFKLCRLAYIGYKIQVSRNSKSYKKWIYRVYFFWPPVSSQTSTFCLALVRQPSRRIQYSGHFIMSLKRLSRHTPSFILQVGPNTYEDLEELLQAVQLVKMVGKNCRF